MLRVQKGSTFNRHTEPVARKEAFSVDRSPFSPFFNFSGRRFPPPAPFNAARRLLLLLLLLPPLIPGPDCGDRGPSHPHPPAKAPQLRRFRRSVSRPHPRTDASFAPPRNYRSLAFPLRWLKPSLFYYYYYFYCDRSRSCPRWTLSEIKTKVSCDGYSLLLRRDASE